MRIFVYSILFVFGTVLTVFGVSDRDPSNAYCFHFTWLGRSAPSLVNCSTIATAPCISPFIYTEDGTPPNVTYMWSNGNQTAISCSLDPGFACMKYSYTFNNAVLNISYFCGKMIEDSTTAVSSGCYNQQVSGYAVEVCACRSRTGKIPCNSSIKHQHSTKMLIILIFMTLFLYYDT